MAELIWKNDRNFNFYSTPKCGYNICNILASKILENYKLEVFEANCIVVRDVYCRLISFYENKIKINDTKKKRKRISSDGRFFILSGYYDYGNNRRDCSIKIDVSEKNKFFKHINFKKFINIICKIDNNIIERHLAPQSRDVEDIKFKHKILLDKDLISNFVKMLKNDFNIEENNFVPEYPNVSVSAGINNEITHKYFNKNMIVKVNHKYKRDFEKFENLKRIEV